jgi:hypothetical protein
VRNACLIEHGGNVSDQLSLPGIRVSGLAPLSGISIALICRTPLSRSSDSLSVRIMSTISNMDPEERHKALEVFEYLREAKVNLLERVRYGAPIGDIESAIEEFEEAWSVAERLVNQLIESSKT